MLIQSPERMKIQRAGPPILSYPSLAAIGRVLAEYSAGLLGLELFFFNNRLDPKYHRQTQYKFSRALSQSDHASIFEATEDSPGTY
jgi:hypothetical protein